MRKSTICEKPGKSYAGDNYMKYVYNIKQSTHLQPDLLRDILPSHFLLQEEGNQLTVAIEHESEIDEREIYFEIQRECDRIFFLTGVQLNPTLICIERPDGSRRVGCNMDAIIYGVKQLPSDLDRQQWTETLKIQLRLWQLADLPNTPLSVQIMLLFQIIERSYPDSKDYPKYDVNQPLHPRTETKLIRHWVSHQGTMNSKELQNYCQINLNATEFYNPLNIAHQRIISMLVEKVKAEAEKVIYASMTRKI